ncbi:protein translocase subunit SecF, partial [Patescibacteria group bacterium]|nr:protein translocase subunit SecF [Patescibacteria group bacterium]
ALLTIMGFSVHDTIVVFDRIRENLKKQARDDTFGDVADISLNQTLTRSINTSISTLFPLMALYVWGAESIRVLIFALIIGIFVGTYSSIFIASPLLTMWQERTRIR